MPSAQQTVEAARVAARLASLPRGERQAVAKAEADLLGVSLPTLYRWMRPFLGRRQRRADTLTRLISARRAAEAAPTPERAEEAGAAGAPGVIGAEPPQGLTEAEAELIAAAITGGTRENGRRIMSMKKAVETLRYQGAIKAERFDRASGEVRPLSLSAIGRGLRAFHVHWAQQRQATPHQPIRTAHPNARWEVDASVCVVYYLPEGVAITATDPAVHYKNKPEQLERIAPARIIRYVVTDHTSGVIRWRYYPHAESAAHTIAFLAWCIAPKANETHDPFHGAPFRLVADPGATASAAVRRFCERLGIELVVTLPHNPRAKGSVEKGQHLVETEFESGLRFQRHRITNLAELNAFAERFQVRWNATEVHRRHGMTRLAAWSKHLAAEIRRTEDEASLRALATEHPATPRVKGDLTVQYRGATWDVRGIPELNIGERLEVAWCPLVGESGAGHAVALRVDAETGSERLYPLPRIATDAWGFRADAPLDGAEYASLGDTPADRARKRLALRASGAPTLEADAQARKAKDFRPLADLDGGRGLDIYKAAEQEPPITWLPKRGTPHRVVQAQVVALTLDHVEAAQRLAKAVRAAGGTWGPERWAWLTVRFPEGVPESALTGLIGELTACAAAVVGRV